MKNQKWKKNFSISKWVVCAAMCMLMINTYAQTISGKVTDESNVPLIGVNIVVQGKAKIQDIHLNNHLETLPRLLALLTFWSQMDSLSFGHLAVIFSNLESTSFIIPKLEKAMVRLHKDHRREDHFQRLQITT